MLVRRMGVGGKVHTIYECGSAAFSVTILEAESNLSLHIDHLLCIYSITCP